MIREFVDFLKNYGVIGLALAVVIGGKVNDLVKSVVENLVMPFVGLLIPSGEWKELGFQIGSARFGVGHVIGSVLDFVIVAGLIFGFSKVALKEKTVAKK